MRTDSGGGHLLFLRAGAYAASARANRPLPAKAFVSSAGSSRASIRNTLRARRAALSPTERIAAAQALVTQVERIPEFMTDARIAGYWAIAGELPLAALMSGVQARGQTWHLPIVDDDGLLRFAPWRTGAALAANRFGIPEPVCTLEQSCAPDDLDVVLVPLLGFDRAGWRLGFGGGYYDRSFAFLRERQGPGKPVLVGIGYAVQEVDPIDAQPWDVRMDYIATERELIDLTPTP